ncbi:nucleoside triphosphate pyrophosphohydrolase [Pokkaliibacter sp. MBI-7]|uniref:nucleoside triphosphate pyrophosphohydrolase n=1 Tax=Pokkaliibacter sp. MBI-7 TaxID=3040600 RepID=UPI002449C655|nr:nucleoside triphosphate pyrophosphohydrolase [Pokkaliibacter sp. MBI-7]MDH2431928.1 nucleoside triphosphate pyrophosphohydrolase [Pokkaliibacter sp. MBI-7]
MTTSAQSARHNLDDLRQLMQRLRAPEGGCPWDRQQTYASILPHTLEEAYEVADAIERQDFMQLKDELGDLLFQVIFYAQLASEEQRFDLDDIIDNLVAKLLRRHPHVFPDGTLASDAVTDPLPEAEIKQRWEEIKAEERAEKGDTSSVLDDVPHALPALNRAHKLQKRAASVGFDWFEWMPVRQKLLEELDEIDEARALGDQDAMEDELGDVLFSCVNLARHLKIDPDKALRRANNKFERRFRRVEQLAEAGQINMQGSSLEVLDQLWDQAKQEGL